MIALREGAKELNHEHFHGGILEVAAKKKSDHFVSLVLFLQVSCSFLSSTLPKRSREYQDIVSVRFIDVITSFLWIQFFSLMASLHFALFLCRIHPFFLLSIHRSSALLSALGISPTSRGALVLRAVPDIGSTLDLGLEAFWSGSGLVNLLGVLFAGLERS
jgi:hypothetical protein